MFLIGIETIATGITVVAVALDYRLAQVGGHELWAKVAVYSGIVAVVVGLVRAFDPSYFGVNVVCIVLLITATLVNRRAMRIRELR